MTASWCVNCHYNKYFVLKQEGLIDFLERRNVVLMRADYTTKSEGIAQLIKEHNRVGIPLNIVYCPKTKIILPEILSQKDIVSAVNQCN
ncbi:MAG: thioredoxin family protein [Candidatus Midichloria sp.]|nr:thioredoxin family protein [Candidatus Midichloria sp.]